MFPQVPDHVVVLSVAFILGTERSVEWVPEWLAEKRGHTNRTIRP